MAVYGFPRAHDGKLLKILHGGIGRLAGAECGYNIAWMDREYEEIRQSYEAVFDMMYPFTEKLHNTIRREDLARANMRRDIYITHLRYSEELLADPLAAFQKLVDNGWPFDPAKAAEVIDGHKQRFKRENLSIGA